MWSHRRGRHRSQRPSLCPQKGQSRNGWRHHWCPFGTHASLRHLPNSHPSTLTSQLGIRREPETHRWEVSKGRVTQDSQKVFGLSALNIGALHISRFLRTCNTCVLCVLAPIPGIGMMMTHCMNSTGKATFKPLGSHFWPPCKGLQSPLSQDCQVLKSSIFCTYFIRGCCNPK